MNPNEHPVGQAIVATAPSPGAVAIIQLHGPKMSQLLHRLTGRSSWPTGRFFLVDIASIDQGLAVRWDSSVEEGIGEGGENEGGNEGGGLYLHGGLLVVQRIIEHLASLGVCVVAAEQVDARQRYPEASSDLKADMLASLATASSPAAIGLLLAQPRLWRQAIREPSSLNIAKIQADSLNLNRLLRPARVVLVGRANIGKSTLTNRLLDRQASLVADHPGTTRDWVGGLAILSGAAIHWLDTPGIMANPSETDRTAIDLAMSQARQADLLIAMRDPTSDWPDESILGRRPDLWVINKSDVFSAGEFLPGDHGQSPEAPMRLSAKTGDGVSRLTDAILDRLGLADRMPRLWAFSPELEGWLARGDFAGIQAYAEQRIW